MTTVTKTYETTSAPKEDASAQQLRLDKEFDASIYNVTFANEFADKAVAIVEWFKAQIGAVKPADIEKHKADLVAAMLVGTPTFPPEAPRVTAAQANAMAAEAIAKPVKK